MAPLDTDALVREISPDAPCGLDPTESIEGSAFQQDLDRLLDATTRGDASDLGFGWEQIAERGIELFGSGKDLRIATTLALCGLHREGLGGFADGVALVRELLERYWDAVHPVPNTFESFPFEDRVFALKNLQRDELLQSLRTVPIVRSSFGQCSFRDYQVSTGAIAAGEAEDGPTISPDDIAVVMGSIGIDGLGELRGHIDRIDAELTSIQSFVDARVLLQTAHRYGKSRRAGMTSYKTSIFRFRNHYFATSNLEAVPRAVRRALLMCSIKRKGLARTNRK